MHTLTMKSISYYFKRATHRAKTHVDSEMEQEGKIDKDEEKQIKTRYLAIFHRATKNICVLLDFSTW